MEGSGKPGEAAGQVCCHLILIALFAVPLIFLAHGGVQTFERGFFCDDRSIRYPYKPDTVDWYLERALGLCVPLAIMLITELPHYVSSRRNGEASNVNFCGINVNLYVVQLYKAAVPFVIAAELNVAVTDLLKYSVGRLRPNFLTVCRPNMSVETCTEDGYYKYVTDYSCTGSLPGLIADARRSFPSGHTSYGFVCAVYLMVAALCVACEIGASRVSDYKHHPTDVLAGAAIGTLTATIVGYVYSSLFQNSKVTVTKDSNINLFEYETLK